ncbi:MAG: class I SAM-dependent methyltransferase, partial [Phormidium sp. GEM2.Bin31]
MLAEELQQEYQRRFVKIAQYRRRVWRVLVKSYFQAKVGKNQDILDLGCGWGEFINQVEAKRKYAMDLNPDAGT